MCYVQISYVQSCPPPGGHLWWLLEEAISEMFLWYLFFLCFDCWFKLERLKREPTNVGSQEILLVLYLYILSFLVRATFGQLSLFSFPNIIFKFKDKGEKVSSLQPQRLPRSRQSHTLGWLWTTIA